MATPRKAPPTVVEYLRRFDCHAINWILSEDNFFFRICWIILVLVITGITVYNSSILIAAFADSPVTYRNVEANDFELRFPKILFCNPEIVNYNKLREDNFSSEVLDVLFDFYFTSYGYRTFGRVTRRRQLFEQVKSNSFVRNYLQNFSLPNFLVRYSYNCEELLLRCVVNNILYDNCCKIAKPVFHAVFGSCYLLSSDKWVQYQLSPTAGVTLTFASLSSDSSNRTNYPSLQHGIYLEMFETYEYAANFGYYYEQNQNVMMSLRKTVYKRSKISKIGCVSVKEANFASSTACENICWIRQYQSTCNCTKQIGYYPRYNQTSLRLCEVLEAMYCLAEHVIQHNEDYTRCLNEFCKPLCDENIYSATVAITSLKPNLLKSYVPKQLKNFNGFIRISIVYSSMSYEKIIEDETLTLQSVISLLGGQVGFWFGGSLITLIQAAIIGFVCIKRRFQKLNACENKLKANREKFYPGKISVTEGSRAALSTFSSFTQKGSP